MTISNIHFTITIGGITGILIVLLRIVYKLGRILERFEQHCRDSAAIHRATNRRLTYLERKRQ